MDKKLLIKKYCEALENGRAAIFAGAGLSVGAGFVDWKGLLKDVAEELNIQLRSYTNLVDLAQYYVNATRNKSELSHAILNAFPVSATPLANHKILAGLPIKTYWTTNFDKLIEKSLLNVNKICDVKSLPSNLAIAKDKSDAIVYKMHGDVDNPDLTILTRDQFEKYQQTHKAFLDSFCYDLTNKTFLFLGLSFDDPNLHYVLKYARMLHGENQRRHYYILRKVSQEPGEKTEDFEYRKREQELFIEDMKNYAVETILIDDYSEITEILSAIQKRYLRRTVFISGAAVEYTNYSEKEVKEFVKKLSARLIRDNFRIVNGYGLGFGDEVLTGAAQQIQNDHKTFEENIKIMPFPQGLPNPKEAWHQYRQEMIQNTGISIFLMGNKKDKTSCTIIGSNGMQEEYDLSKSHGNFLIPVGATGYKTKDLWTQQMSAHDNSFSPTKNEMESLDDETKSLDEHLDTIMSILERINS
jgi:hypothetical protein